MPSAGLALFQTATALVPLAALLALLWFALFRLPPPHGRLALRRAFFFGHALPAAALYVLAVAVAAALGVAHWLPSSPLFLLAAALRFARLVLPPVDAARRAALVARRRR